MQEQKNIDERVADIINEDIRKEIESNRVKILDRGQTQEEAEANHKRLTHIIGIERALKSAGFGNNSTCPCGSEKKFKKCCKFMLRDKSYTPEFIADRFKLRRNDEVIVNRIQDAMTKG